VWGKEEPSLEEGIGQPSNCEPPSGQKYAEASITLLYFRVTLKGRRAWRRGVSKLERDGTGRIDDRATVGTALVVTDLERDGTGRIDDRATVGTALVVTGGHVGGGDEDVGLRPADALHLRTRIPCVRDHT
jgi:hypothetical protein